MEKNRKLSRIFKEMAELTRFLEGSDSFRASAYENAADALNDLDRDVQELQGKELTKIEGIGKSIAAKIEEYFKSGGIRKLDELKGKVPEGLIPLMKVKGLGPKTLRKFHDQLGIVDREGLEKSLKDGAVEALEGFGAKRVEKIQRGLEMHDEAKERILLQDALELGERIVKELQDAEGVHRIELAGSLRRRESTVGDIDVLVAAEGSDHAAIHDRFIALEGLEEVVAHGDSKSSIMLKELDRQVDLRTVLPDQWGAALHYFTGSQSHNVRMRSIANEKGWKLSEYGLFHQKSEERIAGSSEEELFEAFGMDWIPPEMRKDRGETEAAAARKLPELVEKKTIQGELHLHSDHSDGRHSMEEIAHNLLEEAGYSYFAVTDHSKAVGVAGGMDDEGFLKQIEEAKSLKEQFGEDRILIGAEVDILRNGDLDLSDRTLAELDWVVASIHSGMDRDNTERVLKAIENPYVNLIGHPTGRLLGSRSPYPIDMDRVIDKAAKTCTALEINAQPLRMDLEDEWAFKAREKGVPLAINTDMHRFQHLEHLRFGIAVARRAWCSKEDLLNTQGPDRIREHVEKKRELLLTEKQ